VLGVSGDTQAGYKKYPGAVCHKSSSAGTLDYFYNMATNSHTTSDLSVKCPILSESDTSVTNVKVVVTDGHCTESVNCVLYRTFGAWPNIWGMSSSGSSTGCSGGQQTLNLGNLNGTFTGYTTTLDCGLPDVEGTSWRSALDHFILTD
jgi:hypothetical protein